jgi:hypothetical protein
MNERMLWVWGSSSLCLGDINGAQLHYGGCLLWAQNPVKCWCGLWISNIYLQCSELNQKYELKFKQSVGNVTPRKITLFLRFYDCLLHWNIIKTWFNVDAIYWINTRLAFEAPASIQLLSSDSRSIAINIASSLRWNLEFYFELIGCILSFSSRLYYGGVSRWSGTSPSVCGRWWFSRTTLRRQTETSQRLRTPRGVVPRRYAHIQVINLGKLSKFINYFHYIIFWFTVGTQEEEERLMTVRRAEHIGQGSKA